MKFIVKILIATYSFAISANVDLKLDMNFEGNKTSIGQNIEFNTEYTRELKDSKVQYDLSSKRPLNYPADFFGIKILFI